MAWDETETRKVSIPTGMPHICICAPHHGSVQLEWVQTTWAPLGFIPQADFAKSTKLSRGILNLDTERNLLAKEALKDKTVTHILWVDTDMISESGDPNQDLRMLLSCNAPVASGLYRAKKKGGMYPYAMWARHPEGLKKEGVPAYVAISEWSGNWISVDAIGLGFCLMKREVFESVPRPWFVWDKKAPSEDFDFCEKLKKHGYEIRVLTIVRLSHIGVLKVKTDQSITMLDV